LNAGQVAGATAILNAWERRGQELSRNALAYVLATAYHETGATMRPVRETLAKSDVAAVERLEKAFQAGRLGSVKTPYWRPDGDGKSWFGRGLVQLTHKRNYERMSKIIGIDLVADPARLLDLAVSVKVLIEGMRHGAFTGRKLGDYFAAKKSDWSGARRIINGTDRADLVAAHGRAFAEALG
jgi:predicted chitinase